MKYIQTRDESLLELIDGFLSEELSGANSSYYINCLMQMNASIDDASEVLATNPQLLHKFCTVKKQTQDDAHFSGGPSEDLVLQEGVYPIPNTKIFLKLSTEFLTVLKDQEARGELDKGYTKKVIDQLSNPKFIASNSCGISGIKDYGLNISKLKIARTDKNLVSFTRYKDVEGNLVIEFDRLLGHKATDKLQKGTCTTLPDLNSMIYCRSSESSGDHDIFSDHSGDLLALVGDMHTEVSLIGGEDDLG